MYVCQLDHCSTSVFAAVEKAHTLIEQNLLQSSIKIKYTWRVKSHLKTRKIDKKNYGLVAWCIPKSWNFKMPKRILARGELLVVNILYLWFELRLIVLWLKSLLFNFCKTVDWITTMLFHIYARRVKLYQYMWNISKYYW